MPERRLIGIWLVATYFFAKAFVVGALVANAFWNPSSADTSLDDVRDLLPLLHRLNTGPDASLMVASVFVLFGIVVGLSIIARQAWAAAYVIAYHGIALIWFLLVTLGLKTIGLAGAPHALASPFLKIEIVASLLMVAYLLQPRVMRCFGFN